MAEGRQRSQWQHTASQMALLANVNRDPKKSEPFTAASFDPYAPKREPVKVSLSLIHQAHMARQKAAAGKS